MPTQVTTSRDRIKPGVEITQEEYDAALQSAKAKHANEQPVKFGVNLLYKIFDGRLAQLFVDDDHRMIQSGNGIVMDKGLFEKVINAAKREFGFYNWTDLDTQEVKSKMKNATDRIRRRVSAAVFYPSASVHLREGVYMLLNWPHSECPVHVGYPF